MASSVITAASAPALLAPNAPTGTTALQFCPVSGSFKVPTLSACVIPTLLSLSVIVTVCEDVSPRLTPVGKVSGAARSDNVSVTVSALSESVSSTAVTVKSTLVSIAGIVRMPELYPGAVMV